MIKKYFEVALNETSVNISLLILRIFTATLMMSHGYDKLNHFEENKDEFMNFLNMGSSISLGLLIFAELFCSIFLLVGMFTRVALVPLIIAMSVAVIDTHGFDIFGKGEKAFLFLIPFIALFVSGPGKYSLDSFFFRSVKKLYKH